MVSINPWRSIVALQEVLLLTTTAWTKHPISSRRIQIQDGIKENQLWK
jgi:hypothetical protein